MTEMLILTALSKAVCSLELALAQPKNEFIRDAVIQRFEYTYELCWKMLRRYLISDIGVEEVNRLPRKDLFRVAAEKQIITDPVCWFTYHKARNETSHTYDENKAEETYSIASKFCDDAKALLFRLEELNV
ncbi:nucleotidyltransferase substrate binding protein [Alkalimarinus coralli]|uniref:nucleotidyltransferase substrate binding protein n=1 Tax=Alkalimarinus coralli TaxID=2935863 RepID=UPI00202AD8B6|nr:nucleotidyltransferase substrate binding protein [Alkalimarinus coralli]